MVSKSVSLLLHGYNIACHITCHVYLNISYYQHTYNDMSAVSVQTWLLNDSFRAIHTRDYAEHHINKQENSSHCTRLLEKVLTAVRTDGNICGPLKG